jgi:hypothetical protein
MIIAFHAKKQVGKSEAASVLKEFLGTTPSFNVKFAGPLYTLQESAYRMIAHVYERPTNFVKDRRFLQTIGDWMRGLDPELPTKLFRARVAQIRTRSDDVVLTCDDCRYDEEAKTIRALGGVVIGITTTRELKTEDGGIPDHSSEAGISDEFIDYKISNDGTLEEYREALKALYQKIVDDHGLVPNVKT